jgi:hypothetical protein
MKPNEILISSCNALVYQPNETVINRIGCTASHLSFFHNSDPRNKLERSGHPNGLTC